MSNRLHGYHIVLDLERRARMRGRPRTTYSVPEIARRVLHCLVKSEDVDRLDREEIATWDDYELATRAGVSVRQTGELYEEMGLGLHVREVLDKLEANRLITISRRSATGRYRGILPTEQARAHVDLRPWYRRVISFFDPPGSSTASPDRA